MSPIKKFSIAGRLGLGLGATIRAAGAGRLGLGPGSTSRAAGAERLGLGASAAIKTAVARWLGASAALKVTVAAAMLGMLVAHADPADFPAEKSRVAERTAAARARPTTDHAPQTPASNDATTPLASRLIGTWKLIAIRDRDPATGTETPAARAADDGQLIYAANGRLSVQIVRKGRESAPKGSADGFSSYFGRWELLTAEGCVVHHQDGNLNYAQIGQAAKRYYSFDAEGHLSLATPPAKRDDGRLMSTVFVWEKIP